MDPSLRPATPDDAPAVAALWYAGWQDAHLGNVPDELVEARTRSSFDERALARIADTAVAEVDGEVVGFVMVVDDEVDQIYLHVSRRGSGLASVLLAEAEWLVLAGGHPVAWLAVAPGNERARRFYERRGWRDEGPFSHEAPVGSGHVLVPCRRYVKPVSPLVSVGELIAELDDVTVLDVRYRMGGPPGLAEHAAGHVPGAAYVDMDADLAASPGVGGRHPLPDQSVFVAAMRQAGVSASRPVVVYDDWAGHAAARAWWLLRHYGHPSVRVLDGGWSAWVAAGGDVSTSLETPAPGDFSGTAGSMPVRLASEVLDVGVLVDARAAERYRGETEPIDPVAGHVPGAVNVPTASNLTPVGCFRPAAELRELYAAVGAVPGADVAAYCGSGVTACHDLLAMELVGVRAALYPGSWSEWVADPSRPVETGG
ncbi:MAG: GNAT family N-acetyltransferase [Nocardioides sp.]